MEDETDGKPEYKLKSFHHLNYKQISCHSVPFLWPNHLFSQEIPKRRESSDEKIEITFD
jgi:hypothetical protein